MEKATRYVVTRGGEWGWRRGIRERWLQGTVFQLQDM